MPVIVTNLVKYKDTLTPELSVETDVVSIPAGDHPFMVEGYIDLSNMEDGDTVTIKEYISADESTWSLYASQTFSGQQAEPLLRFHMKTVPMYRVTITQTSGTAKQFKYWFIKEELEVV